MRHRQNILIGPDGVFYGENKFTSWALGTRQSEEPGRWENKLIIEVSRWLSNPNRKRFIMTVCATDSSSSSFELVPLPLQYLIWPQVRRLLGALRGISFLFSYLSSFRHPLSPALYLPLSDLPPLQVLLTQQTHTGSQARQTVRLKLGGKNGSLPCSEYESNS